MGGDADRARGPDRQQRQRQVVAPAVELEARRRGSHQCRRRGDVERGVLHPDDVGHLARQSNEHVVADLPPGANGDVVDQHR